MVLHMKQKYFDAYFRRKNGRATIAPSYLLNYLLSKLIKTRDFFKYKYTEIASSLEVFNNTFEKLGGGYKLWKHIVFIHNHGMYLPIKHIPKVLYDKYRIILDGYPRLEIDKYSIYNHDRQISIVPTGVITKLPVNQKYIKLNRMFVPNIFLDSTMLSGTTESTDGFSGYNATRLVQDEFWKMYYHTKYKEKYPQRHLCTLTTDKFTSFIKEICPTPHDETLAVLTEIENILRDLKVKPVLTIGNLRLYNLTRQIPATDYNLQLFNSTIFNSNNKVYMVV